MRDLKSIVSPQFDISQELKKDWERQFRTANSITMRFDSGYRTQLLADEVGMGKTYVAMAAMAHYVFQTSENDRKVLLIVPNSSILRRKWGQELRSFNEQYLRSELRDTSPKRLRPLLVEDYWDLIENLHDYGDVDLSRISETMAQCMALFFRTWWEHSRRRKGSWFRDWVDVGPLTERDVSWIDFSASFSRRAFHEFLNGKSLMESSRMNELVTALESGKSRKEEIKSLFREFACNQDSHEANVFVMTMKSLSRSRRDHNKSRLLNTWMTSRILRGRHRSTKERILELLQASNLITKPVTDPAEHLNWFSALGDADLWGLTEVFDRVVGTRGGTAALFEEFNEESCVQLLGDLHVQLIREKLAEARIGLAVVDEAHNWKNGSNGARDFSEAYAPFIKHKLLLSATPFQLDQSELGKIYSLTEGGEELFGPDLSQATIRGLLEGGLAADCLRQSQAFRKAWQGLSPRDVDRLEEIVRESDLKQLVESPLYVPELSDSLETFWDQFRSYSDSVEKIRLELSKVMLRHVKDRSHRHFHAGRDWLAEGLPNPKTGSHSFLYPVDGFADPRHALLGYLGMRLVQKLNRRGGTGNARLLRGITSSFSAFKASNSEALDSSGLPEDTQAYLKFFGDALNASCHPKVFATAERAFANFKRGRKTLIFCERVPTLDEIDGILTERISALFPDGIPAARKRRAQLLRRQEFIDLHWSRSLFQVMARDQQQVIKETWARVHQGVVDSVVEKLGGSFTMRRIGRLVDLELLALLDEADLPKWAQALRNHLSKGYQVLVAGNRSEDDESNGGVIDPDEPEEEENEVLARELVTDFVATFLDQPNLWFHQESISFHSSLHRLLDAEFRFLELQDGKVGDDGRVTAFLGMLGDLAKGMRKILLRPELFAVRDMSTPDFETSLLHDLWEKPMAISPDESEWSRRTAGTRLEDFLGILAASEGTIQRQWKQDSKRKSLWSGVFLQHGDTAGLVLTLDGSVSTETRVSRCAAFNSPLAPDILICTAIGAEGIDLHRYCAEVIHHDLPWNPAKLEQRIGRIDRVGSLTERSQGTRLLVGIPFLANDYETIQYQVLQGRAQRFEVLLGNPDFSLDVEEEDQDENVRDTEEDEGQTELGEVVLPLDLVNLLRMDLSV